jgi:Trypsin-like peptidase domain
MDSETQFDEVRERAKKALARLRGVDDDLSTAKTLVEALRNQRDYDLMGQLAEAVSRRDPKDAKNRRLYAQYLIDTGKATAAIDLLQPLARRLPKEDPEFAEATGLLGRAHKQVFFDAGDKTTPGAREALKKAIATYRGPYEADHKNTWHGVNLIALLTRARGLGIKVASELNPGAIAKDVVATLQATPVEKRDDWFLPTLAEASLGLDDWDVIERNVGEYAKAPSTKAFHVAGTLRQLEAVLGKDGSQTYQWWKTGLERALSVAAVRQRMGGRVGTGFLVRAGDLGREPADELLLLTNFHVVNELGVSPGIRPDEAEVAFEAVDPGKQYAVAQILWTSPPERHDASLLRFATPVTGIAPLPFAAALPVIDDTARVYIVGHPGGRDLAFSFQDNELLDHEGPPLGKLQIPGVCRLHYRAPTEGGSSGSPVFNSRLWQVIALHHKGGKIGMPKLNGKEGTYGANEGVSIQSIAAAIKG